MSNELSTVQSMKALKTAKRNSDLIGNLYNPLSITKGYLVNNGDGTLLTNTSYATSDFIEVEATKQYLVTNARSLAFYDTNKTYVGGSGGSYPTPRDNLLVRVPFSAKYLRVSSLVTNMENNYLFTIMKVKFPSRWVSKIWASYGDSITQQNSWQPYVTEALGFSHYNYGVGGTKVTDTTGTDTTAMCRDERINQITSGADLISFMGGTNDWINNVSLGTIADTATNTFYGAVKKTLEKLITRFPTKRIIAISTPYGKAPNRAGWNDAYGLKNNLGLTSGDYAKVIVEVSRLYGIPCLDLYGVAGINDINITTYMASDGSYIHPNDVGGTRISEVVKGFLISIEPYA